MVADVPKPDPPKTTGTFSGFLFGEQQCGVDAAGNPQKPSPFAWFWLLVMVLGLIMTAVSVAVPPEKKNDKCAAPPKGTTIGLAVGSIVVAIFNVCLFWSHASKCSATSGFFITLLISVFYSAIAMRISGGCYPQ